MIPEPNLTHPQSNPNGQTAEKTAFHLQLCVWPCLNCPLTPKKQQFAHYCCPRQAYISCECSPEKVKIPIEHVEILRRHSLKRAAAPPDGQ